MKVSLIDDRTLRLSFPFSLAAKSFVAALVGAEYEGKAARTWKVPLCHLRAIVEQFPRAMVEDPAVVIEARYKLWRTWIRNHNACGIFFALSPDDAETVVAYRDDGEPVSDVLQAHVAKRSPQLEPWLHCQRFPTGVAKPSAPIAGEPTDGEALIWRGMQNAARREEQRAEVVERVKGKRRKARMVQAELITEE